MDKEFYDKYGKVFHCGDCNYLEHCIKSEEPLLNSCREEFLSCKVSDLEAKLAESERESNARYKAWQEEIRECDRLRFALADVRKQLAEMTEKYNACQEARKLEIEFSQQDKAELKQQLIKKELELIKANKFRKGDK